MTVLQEAQKLISGKRAESYGPAIENFTRVGYIWTGCLYTKLKPGLIIHPADVSNMMMGLKQARLAYAIEINKINEARDSAVDICGYAALIEKMGFIQEGEEQ
jgi:hypothetical protein